MRYSLIIVIALVGLLSGCLGNSGLGSAIKLTDYYAGKNRLSQEGIDQEDQKNLTRGALFAVKQKYQTRPVEQLTTPQLRLLCDLQVKYNDLGRAHQCLDHLIKRYSGNDDGSQIEAVLGRKALLFLYIGESKKSAEISLELTTQGGRFIHALALTKNDQYDKAMEIAERFSRFYFKPERIYYAANIYMAAGRYDKALELIMNPRTRLLRDYGLAPGTGALGNKVETATFRIDLFEEFKFGTFDLFSYAPKANTYVEFIAAKSYLETGEQAEAMRRFEFIINHADANLFRDIYWMSLFELAQINESEGRDSQAIRYYEQALDLIEGIRGSIATESGRLGFFRDKFDVYAKLVSLLHKVNRPTEALETVERAKGRALVDLLGSRTHFSANEISPERTNTLLNKVSLAQNNFTTRSIGDENDLSLKLRNITQSRQTLIQEAPHLASLVSISPMHFEQLASNLSLEEAGLLYHRFGERLYIFYFDQKSIHIHITNAEVVTEESKLLRDALMNFDKDSYLKHSQKLFDLIIRPLYAHLDNASKLLIIPTDNLHYLPFSALHSGKEFLIERFGLRLSPSLNVLNLVSKSDVENSGLLVLGNPDLNDEALDLPGAESEARTIAAHYPGALLLLRDDASETAFLQQAPNYGLIHIASHGKFQIEQPLQSRLLLAPTNSNSGELTVDDLFSIRLEAQLVVLSACETALGHVTSGDDMVGLFQGLFYAGSRGVIGSLWQIEDNSTAHLMKEMYRHLFNGAPPSTALRKAQLATMKKHPHPFFWSAFQYSGSDA